MSHPAGFGSRDCFAVRWPAVFTTSSDTVIFLLQRPIVATLEWFELSYAGWRCY